MKIKIVATVVLLAALAQAFEKAPCGTYDDDEEMSRTSTTAPTAMGVVPWNTWQSAQEAQEAKIADLQDRLMKLEKQNKEAKDAEDRQNTVESSSSSLGWSLGWWDGCSEGSLTRGAAGCGTDRSWLSCQDA